MTIPTNGQKAPTTTDHTCPHHHRRYTALRKAGTPLVIHDPTHTTTIPTDGQTQASREQHAPRARRAKFLYVDFRGHCLWQPLPGTVQEPPRTRRATTPPSAPTAIHGTIRQLHGIRVHNGIHLRVADVRIPAAIGVNSGIAIISQGAPVRTARRKKMQTLRATRDGVCFCRGHEQRIQDSHTPP